MIKSNADVTREAFELNRLAAEAHRAAAAAHGLSCERQHLQAAEAHDQRDVMGACKRSQEAREAVEAYLNRSVTIGTVTDAVHNQLLASRAACDATARCWRKWLDARIWKTTTQYSEAIAKHPERLSIEIGAKFDDTRGNGSAGNVVSAKYGYTPLSNYDLLFDDERVANIFVKGKFDFDFTVRNQMNTLGASVLILDVPGIEAAVALLRQQWGETLPVQDRSGVCPHLVRGMASVA